MKKYISKNLSQTNKIAQRFVNQLKAGSIFIFSGDLGGGKTTFTKAVGEKLGIKQIITSPTFVLMKVYKVNNNKNINQLCHVDAYRLNSGEELIDIGIEEYLNNPNCLTIIEWGEKVKTILKKPQTIKFKTLNKNSREIIFN